MCSDFVVLHLYSFHIAQIFSLKPKGETVSGSGESISARFALVRSSLRNAVFSEGLTNATQEPYGTQLELYMIPSGPSSVLGVIQGKLIQSQSHLSDFFFSCLKKRNLLPLPLKVIGLPLPDLLPYLR